MCLDFSSLKKLIIKDKIIVLITSDSLYELKGSHLFNIIGLLSSYHQTHMTVAYTLKTTFALMKDIEISR